MKRRVSVCSSQRRVTVSVTKTEIYCLKIGRKVICVASYSTCIVVYWVLSLMQFSPALPEMRQLTPFVFLSGLWSYFFLLFFPPVCLPPSSVFFFFFFNLFSLFRFQEASFCYVKPPAGRSRLDWTTFISQQLLSSKPLS